MSQTSRNERSRRWTPRAAAACAGGLALFAGVHAGADAPPREWFGSPLTGTIYTCDRDAAGTKRLVAPDGRAYPSIAAILDAEGKKLSPLERLMSSDLLSLAADPARGDEIVDVAFIFRRQPAYEAGVAARERANPGIQAQLARQHAILDRIAPLRTLPGDRAPDVATAMRDEAALLTDEEKATLRQVRDAVHDALATIRAEIFAEATPEVEREQAPLAEFLRELPGATDLGGAVTLNCRAGRVPARALLEIAERFPEVLSIERAIPTNGQLNNAIATIGAGSWWTANYIGNSSTKIALLDTGVDTTHPALQNVVSNSANYLSAGSSAGNMSTNENAGSTDDFQGHGTRAAGILVSGDSTYRGIAYGGTILNVKCGYLTNATSPPTQTMQFADGMSGGDWAFTHGATACSISFAALVSSNGTNTTYPWSLFFDAAAFNLGVPTAVACRNNGPSSATCGTPADAFNCIACGSFDDNATTSLSDDFLASTSGRGPTSDGRQKPDLCGPGENVYSTEFNWEGSNPDFGTSLTGTSNVVPLVAGAYSLLQEYGAAAYPAGLTALLFTTANNTSPYGGPDNNWGMGAMDCAAAYTYRGSVCESQLTSSGPRFVLLRGGSLASGARVGLVWSRQIASAGANIPSVYYPIQDLDLYAYDASSGSQVGSSAGTVDPHERLVVSSSVTTPIYKVYRATSPFTSSYTSEPFAVAAESTSSTSVVTPPSLACTFTQFATAVPGSTNTTVTARVANSGGVPAFSPVVTLTLPTGYTLVSGSNPQTLSTIAAGGNANASWVVHTPSGPSGVRQFSVDASSSSYGETFAATTLTGNQTLDVDAPTATVAISGDAPFTNTRDVTVTLTASDQYTGVAQMRVRNSGAAWPSWTTYASSVSMTLTAGEGSKTVEAQFMDGVGNTTQTISDSIMYDVTPPTAAVLIEAGAAYTNSSQVTLTNNVTDNASGVAQSRFSADGVNWGSWSDFAATTAWTLNSGEGTRTVYAQYRDAAGNATGTVSDSIVVDSTSPTNCSIVVAGGANWTTTRNVSLALTASDSSSGVAQMRFSDVGGAWSAWRAFSTTSTWTLPAGDGSKTVFAQFRDAAGNLSATVQGSTNLDGDGPAGTVAIAGGAAFTTSTGVGLVVSATDDFNGVSQMRFSNDGVNWSNWATYATSAQWTLSAGDGQKTVYAQWKDGLGNVTATPATTSIVVDTTPPSGTVVVENDAPAVSSHVVNLNATWTDAVSGVVEMRLSNDGTNWSVWAPPRPTQAWTTDAGDGVKTVFAQYRDAAGNVSASASDSVIVDTTPPTGSFVLDHDAKDVMPWDSLAADTTADDGANGSGVADFRSSADGGATWTEWAPIPSGGRVAVPRPTGSGDSLVSIQGQFRDLAGNVSTTATDSIFVVSDQAPDVSFIGTFTGAVGVGGDEDALRMGLAAGDKLTLKLKTKTLVKKADATVDVDVYGPDHALLVTGRWPTTSKSPGVAKFPAPATGEYWIVLRASGTQADTGVSYSLGVSNAPAKTSRTIKAAGVFDATATPPACTLKFDAVGGLSLAGVLTGPTTAAPTLTAPDGTTSVVAVAPGKNGSVKIVPVALVGGTGSYLLVIPSSGVVTCQLALAAPKPGKLDESSLPAK